MTDQPQQKTTAKQLEDVLTVQLAKTLQGAVTPQMLHAVAAAVSAFAAIRPLREREECAAEPETKPSAATGVYSA